MFRKNDQVISYEQLIEVGPPGLTAVVGSHGTRSCVGSTAIGPSGPFFDVHGHDGAGGFVKRGAPELRVLLPEQAPGMVPLLAVHDEDDRHEVRASLLIEGAHASHSRLGHPAAHLNLIHSHSLIPQESEAGRVRPGGASWRRVTTTPTRRSSSPIPASTRTWSL